MTSPQSILITGASSGIGFALAEDYAAPGVHLFLSGRDEARLTAVAESCTQLGAVVDARLLDVTDATAMQAWIFAADDTAPLDLVIANAGVSSGSGDQGETAEQARHLFSVNVDGVRNTVYPALQRMEPRGRGHVALVSSLAAMLALPGAPAYSATKATVKVWGEALHGLYKARGITVTTICPGFVESRITDKNPFPMPLIMRADKAAKIIRRGLGKKRLSILFPWPMVWLTWTLSMLPPCVRSWILSRAPSKP